MVRYHPTPTIKVPVSVVAFQGVLCHGCIDCLGLVLNSNEWSSQTRPFPRAGGRSLGGNAPL